VIYLYLTLFKCIFFRASCLFSSSLKFFIICEYYFVLVLLNTSGRVQRYRHEFVLRPTSQLGVLVEIYYWRLIRGPARMYTYQREICHLLVSTILRGSTNITRRCPIHGSRARFNSIIMIGFVQNGWDLTHAITARYEQYWHNEFNRQYLNVYFHLRKLSRIIEIFRDALSYFIIYKMIIFFFISSKTLKSIFVLPMYRGGAEVIEVEIFEITLLALESSCVSRSRQRCMKRRKVRGDP